MLYTLKRGNVKQVKGYYAMRDAFRRRYIAFGPYPRMGMPQPHNGYRAALNGERQRLR